MVQSYLGLLSRRLCLSTKSNLVLILPGLPLDPTLVPMSTFYQKIDIKILLDLIFRHDIVNNFNTSLFNLSVTFINQRFKGSYLPVLVLLLNM